MVNHFLTLFGNVPVFGQIVRGSSLAGVSITVPFTELPLPFILRIGKDEKEER